ncbi:MAG: hypothetical protein KAS17_10195 [Victivallaceae bacterium]|nr:hypothetical protein [Victivallaceae bacterium]
MNKKFKQRFYAVVLFFAPFSLMAGDFKAPVGKILGFLTVMAFLSCIGFFIDGLWQWKSGGNYIRDIIIITAIAGTFIICKLIFTAFGLGEAVVNPTF